ncbi:LamG domain-containing protein [Winogradskyella forsetii]|uniref:LamG domain-containing protein n=1 Tax=Winogradskyella forsetii TaxID=2686077 RepID=UPI0015BAD663|nr:LamG domain-containing protein [Winogradskyella forsetii]
MKKILLILLLAFTTFSFSQKRRALLMQNNDTAYAFDKALEFDGNNDFVSITNELVTESITISFWFYGVSGINCVLGSTTNLTDYFRVRNDRIEVRSGGLGDTAENFFETVPINQWNHIFYTYSDNTTDLSRLWLNGVELSHTNTSDLKHTFRYNIIGEQQNNNAPFDGALDDVLMYNSAVSNPDIKALEIYNGADPLTIIPLAQHLYRFNDNANNEGSLGGAGTLNNFVADPYVTH